jgi:hypothetical protein
MVDAEKAAYERFLAGNRALERADADAAVLAYRDALAILPDEPPYAPSRGSLGLRLALACAQKYDDTGDLRWLEAERAVLRAHAGRLREIRPSDPAARERLAASVQHRLRQLAQERERVAGDHGDWEQQIDRSLRGEYTEDDGPRWSPASEDLRWYPRPDDPRPKGQQAADGEVAPEKLTPSDDPVRGRRKGVGLVAAGAVALGAGVAGLAMMGAGMARASAANDFDPMGTPDDRLAQIHRGQTGNTMAVVGLATGSALLVTGAALVGVGAKRLRASAPRRAAIAPFAGPGTAGLVLRGTLP